MLKYVQKNVDITHLSNYKTPATSSFYYELFSIDQLEELKEIFKWIKNEDIQYLIVGGGTNMLFAFDNFEGIIIKNSLLGWTYNSQTQLLESYSAENIRDIAQILETDDNQDIWHRFIGLPGSVGGAVYGNAGCFGLEAENNFLEAFVLDTNTGDTHFLSKDDMNFSYRSSILKERQNYFLLKVKFDLSKKIEKYHSDVDNIHFREYKQPKGNTCGSFFKNPNREFSAGYLIEQIGGKGLRIGGAYFSELHANFLINNKGTYKDLLTLINTVKTRVKEKFNIDLINEVRIITNK